MTINIEGIDNLKKLLKSLPNKVKKSLYKKAMKPAMKLIHDAAKANAPVDSGLLKDSIKIKAFSKKNFVGVDVFTDATGDTFYGAFQEYGTSKMAPKGYMRQAVDSQGQAALDLAAERIKHLIEQEAKK